MKINVTENKVSIKEEQILNENEYNIHKIQFDFSSEYTDDLVKVALFSIDNHTYKKIISNNECDIPPEVLTQRGYSILGVYAYKTEQDTLVLRYSPSPTRISVYNGSYKADAENSEPITPSEIEQYQQILQNSLQQFQNQYNALVEETEGDIQAIEDELQRKVDEGYFDGEDGFSPIAKVIQKSNGATIEIEDKNGKTTADVLNGQDGYTPQRGIDYFTEQDIEEIETDVKNDLEENVLVNYSLTAETGSKIELSINTTDYKLKAILKDKNNATICTSNEIDLPLETMVVNATYDNTTKKIILTLQNGTTVEFSVADLVAGLQTEITSQNKLASDLVDDTNSGNKFVTTTEKQTWNNKLDESDLTDYVKNTDYASPSKGGVIKTSSIYKTSQYNGMLYADEISYADYENNVNRNFFIGKGTLENVITGKQLINQTQLEESQESQDEQIEVLQTENARLKATLPTTTGEGTGQDVTLNKTAEFEFIKPPLPMGNSEQEGEPSPDNEVPITNVTGDVEVVVENKNLFDKTIFKTINGDIGFDISKLKIGEQYTFSSNLPITIFKISNYSSNYNSVITANNNGFTTFTFTMSRNIQIPETATQYLFIGLQGAQFVTNINDLANYNMQIEKGSTQTDYVKCKQQTFTFPLGNEKLMLGDYLADDGIHHVRKQIVLDGSDDEGWYKNWEEDENHRVFMADKFLPDSKRFPSATTNILCKSNYFKAVCYDAGDESIWRLKGNDNYPNLIAINDNEKSAYVGTVTIKYDASSDVNEFKTWLSTHNVTVEYELEQEVIVPYTSAQQEVYNQIKQALSYEEQTNIRGSSNGSNPIFSVEGYQSTKLVLEENNAKYESLEARVALLE